MPTLILFNAKLWTQDAHVPQASAIAIRAGRILAAGNDDDIRALAGPQTRQIDLAGRRVLPGLTDSHIHFLEWAKARRNVRLAGSPSLAAALAQVKAAVETAPAGRWIRGQGWNEGAWPEQRMPNRADLDAVAPRHPVMIWRSDLHLAVANSPALQLAGLGAATPDPEAGIIGRDAAGRPNGILKDMAVNLVSRVMPKTDEAEIDAMLRDAMTEAHRLGLTGIHDFRMMTAEEGQIALRAWQRLRDAGDLNLRVWSMLAGASLHAAIALGLRSGFGDDRLRLGGIKLFADGSLGARTAWMLAPYSDGGLGLPIVPMREIADKVARAHAAGISVGVHAIGDRAIRELLDVFSDVLPSLSPSHSPSLTPPLPPHRIEHVQHSTAEDLKRLGELGLVASVQPLHLVDDMALTERAIGQRERWTYAFRDLLDGGAVLALGSDCPVADPNPFLGIHAAVTRQRRDGAPTGGWHPAQRLSVAEAVHGYTLGPAIASGWTGQLGSLAPGKLADLIVLDRDIFAGPPAEIADTQVVMTIFEGRIVYEKTGDQA